MKKNDIPTSVALFLKDLINPPREFDERAFNVTHWTDMPKGVNFAAMEEP